MRCTVRLALAAALALSAWLLADSAQAQLRIVTYNTNHVHESSPYVDFTNIMQAMGRETTGGVTKPIDMLMLQEMDFTGAETQVFVNILNGLYGTVANPTPYARTNFPGLGDSTQTAVYNTQTLTLMSSARIGNVSPTGAPRTPMRYEFKPVGYDDSAHFYVYESHYKAGQGVDGSTTNEARRNVEATTIRNNANALGQGTHIIYAGDFNVYDNTEAMWGTLTFSPPDPNDPSGTGYGQAFDPINRVGNWHNNFSFRDIHTQAPSTVTHFPDQTLGGVDDRFDWQMVTNELLDDEGMSMITSSYHPFGNNGTTFNLDTDNVNNTALNSQNWDTTYGSGYTAGVRHSLAYASDHLPLVAQYQVPAQMKKSIAAVPAQVIVGASLSAQVTVWNSAGDFYVTPGDNKLVIDPSGADELDYTVAASGAASGLVGGTDSALGGTNTHPFALNTATAGAKSASFQATATSPQVPNPTPAADNVNYNVLDHANASFDSGSDQNSLTVDLGTLATGSGYHNSSFSINNLAATLGFTAPLDSVSYVGGGATGLATTNLTAISNLAAGSGQSYLAIFNTDNAGDYTATYTLTFSDDTALLGATSGPSLILTLQGHVAGTGVLGDFDDDGDIDADDIDQLCDLIHGGSDPNDTGDVNGDGAVNQDDMDRMVGTILNTRFGDSDLDGDVDGNDFEAWRTRPGYTGAGSGHWAIGDFDCDGDVDGQDFDIWRTRPTALPGGDGSGNLVCEPSSFVLIALALPALPLVRNRIRRSKS